MGTISFSDLHQKRCRNWLRASSNLEPDGAKLGGRRSQLDLFRGVSVVEPRREIIECGGLHLSCAICEERKEKRFCPAVHGKICPQCCGEQREVTLDCPSDCPYLLQAREHATTHHANAQNERLGARDHEALFPEVEIPDVEITEQFLYEREELILGLSFALAKCARA